MIKSYTATARRTSSDPVSASRSLLAVVRREVRAAAYPAWTFALSFFIFWWARGYALTDTTAKKSGIVWDAGWYLSIIERGYFTDGNPDVYHNVVFFPLYPLICLALKKLFGLTAAASLYAGSALLTAATFIIIAKIVERQCGAPIARSAILLFAFSPFAIFLYNGYSEPAFLFCIALFFYLLLNCESPLGAACAVGLASASRPYGCLLAVVLALELFRRHVKAHGFRIVFSVPLRQACQFIPLCFTGIAAYTAWLAYHFREPLAFSHNMRAWGATPGEAIDWYNFLTFAYIPRSLIWASTDLASPYITGVLLLIATPLLLMAWRRSLHPSWVIFGGIMFLFFHVVTHVGGPGMLLNMGRHLLVVFPVIVGIALTLDPANVERALRKMASNSEGQEPVQCLCGRVLCTIPLITVIGFSASMFVRNTILFYHEKFVS
jgi:hypothetical protein